MAFSDKKISEGLEHLRLGDKCMKTSFFKWKPDYDGAASEYSKAGVAFKNAKAYEQAINSYSKAADAHKNSGSSFHAGKSLEAAALVQKEQGELDDAADLIERACALYLDHGTHDTAASSLDRAGKMLEQKAPERAITLYMKACDISEAEDRPLKSAEFIGRAGRLLIKLKRLEEAIPVLKRELDYYELAENNGAINKLMLGVMLCYLHLGDYVAADKEFQSALRGYKGFLESEEAGSLERLLQAYDEGDQDEVERILKSPHFKFMENAFTKLARDLQVPGGGSVRSHPAAAGGGDSQTSPQGEAPAGEEEEDEFAGGLC